MRDGTFLVECTRTLQAMGLLKTTLFVDWSVRVSIHKGLNLSRGIICCCELTAWWKQKWRTTGTGCCWGPQGDGEKRDTEKVPTNTLFLTFNTPEMPKEIMVSYLKVSLFVLNLMRCFNCNKFGHTSQCCKVPAKCQWCRKDKHEGRCEGPKLCSNCSGPHASSAQDCLVWQKEKEIQCIHVEKHSSFWKPDSW